MLCSLVYIQKCLYFGERMSLRRIRLKRTSLPSSGGCWLWMKSIHALNMIFFGRNTQIKPRSDPDTFIRNTQVLEFHQTMHSCIPIINAKLYQEYWCGVCNECRIGLGNKQFQWARARTHTHRGAPTMVSILYIHLTCLTWNLLEIQTIP